MRFSAVGVGSSRRLRRSSSHPKLTLCPRVTQDAAARSNLVTPQAGTRTARRKEGPMSERIAVSEAHRAGMLSLLPSDYRIEREGDALLLLKADGSAVAAFRVESVPPAEAAKTAEEDRGRSRRGRSTA